MKRRDFLAAVPASMLLSQVGIAKPAPTRKGVMMMNRIAPSVSELRVCAADGTGERKVLAEGAYDYNAMLSHDGSRLVFTSERLGDGNSSLFIAKGDGTGVTALQGGPSVDDAAALSPDGKWLAFVSTRNGYKANIWVMNLASGKLRQLTGIGEVKGEADSPIATSALLGPRTASGSPFRAIGTPAGAATTKVAGGSTRRNWRSTKFAPMAPALPRSPRARTGARALRYGHRTASGSPSMN
ncbi:TolB family protein [Novosphingobium sp. 9]|uniref:TolB family protein n=1 Tax=Novosphingobium sp. 9 TaxID=2025349 RepID=UPI0021B6B175|nr:hypothetical protein [Novosphingobium sp. 9]